MNAHYYDIESVMNAFTLCNFRAKNNLVDIFYLCDDDFLTQTPSGNFYQDLKERVYLRNKNFNGDIALYDLHQEEANKHLWRTFGLSDAYMINDPKEQSSYASEYRLVCDTDPEYNEELHPYLMGYNSYNYDTTMLALYGYEIYPQRIIKDNHNNDVILTAFVPTTAKQMRMYNDDLFSKDFKPNMPAYLSVTRTDQGTWSKPNYQDQRWRIRKNMMLSGRHLDVARLNEKQAKVALKRLLGQLGYQILESNKLKPNQNTLTDSDQFMDLIAYNISDCVNLQKLEEHKLYTGQFRLKQRLLKTYPELIYQKQEGAYKPDIRPNKVRRDRLTIDCTSAKFSTMSLCPYGHLKDIPTVSYLYPSERKAKELGIKRVNVLDEAKKFFYSLFPQPEIRAQFDIMYNYYKSLEGKNFNESQNYYEDWGDSNPPHSLTEYEKAPMSMPYFKADGTPSSCFITFSTGGIHGAEYNKALYDYDLAEYQSEINDMAYVRTVYSDPIELKKAKSITMLDGTVRKATDFLKSGSTLKKASFKDLKKKEIQLFKNKDDGSNKLHSKYTFTSAALCAHEDFTSYYPNLLRMMEAFFNEGLGYDRYAEIFFQKQYYGILMKEKNANITKLKLKEEERTECQKLRATSGLTIAPDTISAEERELYAILREGTKLILNSASGSADANYESSIRMNNTIISMRIIGQLFSWRIGQAQTYRGATVISTNTDGLFSVMDDMNLNNQILEEESADIGVEIEPELTILISKDTNNRIEVSHTTGKILAAGGGTTACRTGPKPEKALNHPAIIDWALSEYLIAAYFGDIGHARPELSLHKPLDEQAGRNIFEQAKKEFDLVKYLIMFQNIIASSPGTNSYVFGIKPQNTASDPIILQHYNRVFIMKDHTPNTIHLYQSAARKITAAMINKRKAIEARMQQHDPIAVQVANANGVSLNDISYDKEFIIKKVTNIEDDWYMLVMNKDLHTMDESELNFIKENLDYDKYLQLLKECFEKNWMNKLPPQTETKTTAGSQAETIISEPPLFADQLTTLLQANIPLEVKLKLISNSEECATETITDTYTLQQLANLLQKQEKAGIG